MIRFKSLEYMMGKARETGAKVFRRIIERQATVNMDFMETEDQRDLLRASRVSMNALDFKNIMFLAIIGLTILEAEEKKSESVANGPSQPACEQQTC